METMFLICAILGGTVLVCQFLMTLLGLGSDHDLAVEHDLSADHDMSHDGHHDVHHDMQTSWFVGVLTFRTIVAAIAFFGLGGLIARSSGMEPTVSVVLAVAGGIAAMFLVASMMRGLVRLRADGTVRIDRAVGASGTVYLTIPANKAGAGKVTLTLQNRTMEYQAVTSHEELPTGTKVVAVAVVGPGTIEVAPVAVAEGVTHV